MAYDNLLGRSRAYRQHNLTTGDMLSQEAARGRPLVHFYWLRRSPTGANRPLESGSHMSRLVDYLGADHCGEQVPWEDRQRIYTWIDANVPYYGDYQASRPLSPGGRDLCATRTRDVMPPGSPENFWRCTTDAAPLATTRFRSRTITRPIWDGRFAWINFTHPEWSPALTAHLSKNAGGRGLSVRRPPDDSTLFRDTQEPDYVKMLEAIREGRRHMLDQPRKAEHGLP